MRKINAENKDLLEQYTKQLIDTTENKSEMLDFTIVRRGVDFLMEIGKYETAENCLHYHIKNQKITIANKFSLACRGLLLCSFESLVCNHFGYYEAEINDLEEDNYDITQAGKESYLYKLYELFNKISVISCDYFTNDYAEFELRKYFKDNFNNLANIIENIPYYKMLFEKWHIMYPTFILDILYDAAKYEVEDEEILVNAATCLRFINKNESLLKAKKLLNNVLDRNAYNDRAWYEIGNIHHELKEYEDELKAYKYAELINKEKPEYVHKIADTYYYQEMYTMALEYYKRYNKFPSEKKLFNVDNFIGNCYMNMGQFEEALESYNQFTNKAELNSETLYSNDFIMKIICLIKLGKTSEAEKEYEKLNKKCVIIDAVLWSSLNAQILLAQGKQEEAESFLMEMTKRNNYNTESLIELIEFQLKHETYILARYYINLLLETRKDMHNALMYEAVVDYKSGDKNTAAENLNTAYKLDPLAKENFKSYCPEAKDDQDFQNKLIELPF